MRHHALRLIVGLLSLACIPALASAQAVIVPSPIPALTNGCTLKWVSASSTWTCSAPASASQPLDDTLALVGDNGKNLLIDTSAITAATTRTWTVADANITFPSTIASLGANTFTALQTLNGGLAATTGTFSSTLGVTGDLAVDTNKFAVTASNGNTTVAGTLTVNGFGTHAFSAGATGGNIFRVTNTSDGTGNYAELGVTTNASTGGYALLKAFPASYATSGPYVAAGAALYNGAGGGLSFAATHASGAIRFYSGGTTERMSLSSAGVLTVSGFGAHTFSAGGTGGNAISLSNTTSGTANYAYFEVAAGTNIQNRIYAFPQGYTSSGPYVANSLVMVAPQPGGISIGALDGSGAIRFYSGGTTERGSFSSSGVFSTVGAASIGGNLVPSADNGSYLGVVGARWIAVYAVNGTIQTSDKFRKTDLAPLALGVDFLADLKPQSFRMRDEPEGTQRHGLIAQDVITSARGRSLRGILSGERDGEYGLNYAGFVPSLIAGWQAHEARLAALEDEVARLRAQKE